MSIDIKLPNPKYFNNQYSDYFDQLELAVYHARKSYEKFKESAEKPDDILIWISPSDIDGADSLIKKIESADASKDKDRDEVWLETMENLEINISY